MLRPTRRFLSCSFLFSSTLSRLLALFVAYAFLLTLFAPVAWANGGGWTLLLDLQARFLSLQRQGDGSHPAPGPPEGSFPNLDDDRTREYPEPRVPDPIPSTVRSKRNPMTPRNGRRVGDPLPQQGAHKSGTDGLQQATVSGFERVFAGFKFDRASFDNSGSALGKQGIQSGWQSEGKKNLSRGAKLSDKERLTRSHHAVRKAKIISASYSAPPLGDDQFVQNFFQWALVRQPNSTEATYWQNMLRAAYLKGHPSVMMAARELGKTLFETSEYAARGRTDYYYVYDLYKTFLMREPDQAGWNFWTSMVPSMGRENVRRAFDTCEEFSNLMATLTGGTINGAVSSLLTARVDGYNQPGKQLQSRSAVWSVPVLSLPGRAGLDLGLTLAQASTTWVRSGPYIYFDEDTSFPSPGFRLGFPTVQERFFNAEVGCNAYILITPSGNRIELRQIGSSNTYEAADSSYLQLIDNGSSLLVRTTDGTMLSYGAFNNEYRVVQVKDRNGNYLTVNNNWLGQITNITDTLGRVINFNYDGNANLLSITQVWGQQTHTWATFGWSTHPMQSSFSGVSVVGPPNGTQIPVITQIGLPDGSRYAFEYTNALQVSVVRRYSPDNVQRSYVVNGYGGAADDRPRLTQTRVWADNWTGINGVPSEVLTQYSVTGGAHEITAPDGTIYKEFYGTGWKRNLVTQSEVWSGGVRRKWTTFTWTQDNTGLSYEVNPRVIETNVYDAEGNRRRTEINYHSTFGLPWIITEYAANATTVLRRTYLDYKNEAAYIDRRVIGLLYQRQVFDGSWNLQSRVVYGYDWAGELFVDTPAPATQHDRTNYGPGFVTGRGNLQHIIRMDITDPDNQSKWQETKFRYNTTGSLLVARDHNWHETTFAYGDSFSDDVNRNTFAYPTTVTDADGHSSFVKYNFNFGGRTRTQGPPPANQSQGIIQTMTYDTIGRLERVTTTNNSAYTRYLYGNNNLVTLASVNTVADEFYQNEVFDGLGRTVGVASNHPGSTGGYKAQLTAYDLMGRAMKQSNPAEIDGWWTPAGDDAAGWLYTQQTYDWQGRPRITTNTDGTTREVSYAGCGCAGGEVVTLTDEGTIDGGVFKRRQQKIYSDVLGRNVKTEVLNWQGGTVYSATVNEYNARDQITQIRQYAGAEGSGTYQDTIMTYDGHGRLKTRHVPEQNAGAVTTYNYNADDTVFSVIDGRNATCSYGYNNRHQVTSVSHSLSGQATINVTYGYDAAGNRTLMAHSIGGVPKDSASYSYDQLSRMTSETRFINALTGSPTGGYYTINYGYTLSGQLQSVTDPFNSTTNLSYDAVGRTASVTGSYGGVNYYYASSVSYRAWGAVKSASFGNNTSQTVSYNGRLQPTEFRHNYMRYDYSYFDDGRLKQFMDLDDQVGSPSQVQFHYMSRVYSYDHAERIKSVGQVPNYNVPPPFSGAYGYDAFGNMTSRSGNYALNSQQSDTATYTNNRRSGWTYDADGRVIASADNSDSGGSSTRTWTYDAAGRVITISEIRNTSTTVNTMAYDGDGHLLYESVSTGSSNYRIRSTVLGAMLTKLDATGNKNMTYVPANGLVAPMQRTSSPYMTWTHRDPLGVQESPGGAYDPLGNLIHNVQPPQVGPPPYVPFYGATYGGSSWSSFINANNFSGGCYSAANNNPALCNDAIRRFNQERPNDYNPDFWSNLPTQHGELQNAENDYISRLNGLYDNPRNGTGVFWVPPDDSIPGRFGHFVLVTPHVAPGSRFRSGENPYAPQDPKYPPVTTSEINVVYGGQQFDFVQDDIVDAIVDIANRQACSDAFKKYSLTIPYDIVKSGKLRVAGTAALYQANATQLLGWSEAQVAAAKDTFEKEDRLIRPSYTADLSYRDIPTVVFSPTQVRAGRFGSLRDVVTHAFIHLGGQPGDRSATPHDLANFKGYDEILKACR